MKKKIFFVYGYKYFEKYNEFFNIKHLKNYFDIYIFDLHKIFSKNLKKNIRNNYKDKNFHIISKISNFENFLKVEKPNFVILEGPADFKIEIAEITNNISEAKIVEFYNGSVPEDVGYYNSYGVKKILLSYKVLFFSRIILNRLIKIIFGKFKSIFISNKKEKYLIDILFYAGDDTLKLNDIRNKKIYKKVPSPSYDYDISLRQKRFKKRIIKKRYAVFLDSMIMHHQDLGYNYKDIGVPVTSKYFQEMNNFFKEIEKKFNLEVVIALHPNCFIKNYSKYFDNRKCIKFNTARLVKNSVLVFSHASSTAINFAIIYKKPIIYIITNEMKKNYLTYKRYLIKKKIFKFNFLNASNVKTNMLSKKFKIDTIVYKSYYKNYINSCSNKKKSLSKVILENLN